MNLSVLETRVGKVCDYRFSVPYLITVGVMNRNNVSISPVPPMDQNNVSPSPRNNVSLLISPFIIESK